VIRALREWGPAVAWAAVLFAVSARPTIPVDMAGGWDKVAHFGAYFVLGLLLARTGRRRVLLLLLGWAYALSDEVHQSFVPGRDADPADWLADAFGVLVGLLIHHRVRRGRVQERAASSPRPEPFST
jgi:VanZ family protein